MSDIERDPVRKEFVDAIRKSSDAFEQELEEADEEALMKQYQIVVSSPNLSA